MGEAGPTKAKIEPKVAFGRAYREVLHCAAAERADVVVIGAQGHGVFEHIFSGSNAQHVIRGATCPVLTVRPLTSRAASRDAQATGLTLSATAHAGH